MIVAFSENAWDDYLYWQRTDSKVLKRINELIREIAREPYGGIGKPEQLRNQWSGWWSRRVDQEHRLVYRVDSQTISVAQCRYRY